MSPLSLKDWISAAYLQENHQNGRIPPQSVSHIPQDGLLDIPCCCCKSFGRLCRREDVNKKYEDKDGTADECEPALSIPNEIQNPQRTDQHNQAETQ